MLTSIVVALFLGQADDRPVPAALVASVKGTVKLTLPDGKSRTLKYIELVYPDNQLTIPADGEVTLTFLKDGHREKLGSNKTARVTNDKCVPADAVIERQKPRTDKIVLDGLLELQESRGRLAVSIPKLHEIGAGEVIAPVGSSVVLSDRPSFRWRAGVKASNYSVELCRVLDDGKGTEKRLWNQTMRNTRLDYPAREENLTAGDYVWRVWAHRFGQRKLIVESTFSFPSPERLADLRKLEPLASSKNPADLVEAALGYKVGGVYDKAFEMYQTLIQMHPRQATLYVALAAMPLPAERARQLVRAREAGKKLGIDAIDLLLDTAANFERVNEYAEAWTLCEAALMMAPNDARVQAAEKRAHVSFLIDNTQRFLKAKRHREAISELEMLVDEFFDDPVAAKFLKKVSATLAPNERQNLEQRARAAAAMRFKGVVTIENRKGQVSGSVMYRIRWRLHDETWTDWQDFKLDPGVKNPHSCAGATACQIEFDQVAGDKDYTAKLYDLPMVQVDSNRQVNVRDGQPYYFRWKNSTYVDLFR